MPRVSSAALPPADRARAAVIAGCDPRTVSAYLAARPQTSTTVARVEGALREIGRADLVRKVAA